MTRITPYIASRQIISVGWIPTEKEKPPVDERILIGSFAVDGNDAWVSVGYYQGDEVFWDEMDGGGRIYASHWMPLPAPPKM